MILARKAEQQMQRIPASVFRQIGSYIGRSVCILFRVDDEHYMPQIYFLMLNYFFFMLYFQAKAGFILNILGVSTINIAINTWGVAMFQLNTFPSWANVTRAP